MINSDLEICLVRLERQKQSAYPACGFRSFDSSCRGGSAACEAICRSAGFLALAASVGAVQLVLIPRGAAH